MVKASSLLPVNQNKFNTWDAPFGEALNIWQPTLKSLKAAGSKHL